MISLSSPMSRKTCGWSCGGRAPTPECALGKISLPVLAMALIHRIVLERERCSGLASGGIFALVALGFVLIYKASDVPGETRRDDINFATPLTCFGWQNVYVYDFDKEKFQTDIADLPRWAEPSALIEKRQEPSTPIDLYLMVIFITLFIAVALLILTPLSNFLRQKDRR